MSKPSRIRCYRLLHIIDSLWCWCDPTWLVDCALCDGEGTYNSKTCSYCGGTGSTFASDPAHVDRVVHDETAKKSPFDVW